MTTTPRQKAKILHWWADVRKKRGEPYSIPLRIKFNWPSLSDDEAKQVMEEYMALSPKHYVECRLGERLYSETFRDTNSAALFVKAVIGKDKIKWKKDDRGAYITMKDDNLVVRCEELEDILEFETSSERKLPEEQRRQIEQFLTGHWRRLAEDTSPVSPTGSGAKTPKKGLQGSKQSPPDGMVTLADICERLKIEPRKARAFLRKRNEAHDGRWSWGGRDVQAIEKLLKGMKS